MPPRDKSWAILHRTADLEEARLVVTSLAAMEFDVALVDARGGVLSSDVEQSEHVVGPFAIHVPHETLGDLRDVLGELLAEQREFDAMLERKRQRTDHLSKRVLIALMLATIGVLVYMKLMNS